MFNFEGSGRLKSVLVGNGAGRDCGAWVATRWGPDWKSERESSQCATRFDLRR